MDSRSDTARFSSGGKSETKSDNDATSSGDPGLNIIPRRREYQTLGPKIGSHFPAIKSEVENDSSLFDNCVLDGSEDLPYMPSFLDLEGETNPRDSKRKESLNQIEPNRSIRPCKEAGLVESFNSENARNYEIDHMRTKVVSLSSEGSQDSPCEEGENSERVEGSKSVKKRGARPRKLPGAPKRARAPYIFFQQSKREEVKKSLGNDAKGPEVLQKCAFMWRQLSEESKKPYNQKAVEDKARYDREMKAFRSSNSSNFSSLKMVLKDVQPPRRGASAFLQYSKANRDRIKLLHPEAPNKELSKLLGNEWHSLSQIEKAPYQDLALKDANRYKEQMAQYSANGGRSKLEAVVAETTKRQLMNSGVGSVLVKSILPTLNHPLPQSYPTPMSSPFPQGPFPIIKNLPMPCNESKAYMNGIPPFYPYSYMGGYPGLGCAGMYGMNPGMAFNIGNPGMLRPAMPNFQQSMNVPRGSMNQQLMAKSSQPNLSLGSDNVGCGDKGKQPPNL